MTSEADNTPYQHGLTGADETAERILNMATALFLDFGYRRTTIEIVAKRLGVSRVTVYRYFADKAALFQAVVLRETARASMGIEQHLNTLAVEDNPVVEGFVQSVILARQNPFVRRLLETEPEWLALQMTVEGGALLMWSKAAAAAFLHQPKFKEWLKETELDMAAEIFVRMLFSAVMTPGGIMSSDDEESLRRVAHYLVQPLLRHPS